MTLRRSIARSRTSVPVLAVGAALALAGGSASAAPAHRATVAFDDGNHPAPPVGLQPYTACDDAAGNPLTDIPWASGLPVISCIPNTGSRVDRFSDSGSLFTDTTQQVNRPKLTVTLPPFVARTFYAVCTGEAEQPCPAGYDIELPDPLVPGYFGVVAAVYAQSPPGSALQYGTFASVTVDTYALGSIPVTARVTIRQAVDGGTVEPLRLTWGSGTVGSGTVLGGTLSRFGPAPSYPDSPVATLFPPAHVKGPITISLSDVEVDGVPLDVGDDCSTATTLDLTQPGEPGWADSNARPTKGSANAYNPFFVPSYLTSNLDIPAFTDCRSARGEDLDPLITGLISGPDNTLDVTQAVSLLPFACLPAFTESCIGEHPATIDPSTIPIPSG